MKLQNLFLFSVLGLLGCSPAVPKLVAQPIVVQDKIETNTDVQVFNPKVDILFVIDNSFSMDEHQSNLISNLNRFAAAFSKNVQIDYHVGVLTTDMNSFAGKLCCGKLVGSPIYVERSTVNGQAILARNLRVGTSGDGYEKSFDPVVAALLPPLVDTANRGFYRQDAHVAVIFLTDAEDQSQISPKDFYQFLLQLKGQKEKVLSYGAIIPTGTNEGMCRRDETGTSPLKIESFLSLVYNAGKNIMSLCDGNFGDQLAKISEDLVKYVGNVIYLNRPPILDTIKVTYGTQVLIKDYLKGWSFDPSRNAIVLGPDIAWSQQPTGTRVKVYFEATSY